MKWPSQNFMILKQKKLISVCIIIGKNFNLVYFSSLICANSNFECMKSANTNRYTV